MYNNRGIYDRQWIKGQKIMTVGNLKIAHSLAMAL